ncbi:hypothetical protein XELAEV_18047270mg [Xenopus laevis]|uniref:Uncharacterized protein n=1 Tax=Xenopus laevis TaxID=8355 RepID=A0A974H1R6_XENLA|nr:hypothetical protein XELAEV_18047270mg [Xenopus laevis]
MHCPFFTFSPCQPVLDHGVEDAKMVYQYGANLSADLVNTVVCALNSFMAEKIHVPVPPALWSDTLPVSTALKGLPSNLISLCHKTVASTR